MSLTYRRKIVLFHVQLSPTQSSLQEQCFRSLHDCDAFGNVVHSGCCSAWSSTNQPKSDKFSSASSSFMQRVYMSDCDTPRRTCYTKASVVGGKLSIVLFICVNKHLQHFSTVLCGQVLSYVRTLKCWIISKSAVEISPDHDSLIKVSVTSRKAFHAFHLIGLPRPRNCDTISHPVNTYQK